MASLNQRIGIDLGTTNSLVFVQGAGIVLDEPTVVAVSREDSRIIAIGGAAKEMLGRAPENIIVHRPMRDGVIANYRVTEALLRYFIDKVSGRWRMFKPEVMISAPTGITPVEKRAVMEATIASGARMAYLIDEALAAAIGAGIPIAEASGNMIVDIGGGTTEAAVIALGGIVTYQTTRVAGNKLDEAIMHYFRQAHNLLIGEQMAEEIKVSLAEALPPKEDRRMQVKGRSFVEGLPKTVEVTADEIYRAIQPQLILIMSCLKTVLEKTMPELVSDIADKGMILSGGTSQLRRLDELILQEIGVLAHVAEEPMQCVVKGTGIAIENLDKFQHTVKILKG